MKLPRWVVTVLWFSSVIVVVWPPVYWWVTWPERTARLYAEHLASGQDNDPLVTTAGPTDLVLGTPLAPSHTTVAPEAVTAEARSPIDVLRGRQNFKMNPDWSFAVQRGR